MWSGFLTKKSHTVETPQGGPTVACPLACPPCLWNKALSTRRFPICSCSCVHMLGLRARCMCTGTLSTPRSPQYITVLSVVSICWTSVPGLLVHRNDGLRFAPSEFHGSFDSVHTQRARLHCAIHRSIHGFTHRSIHRFHTWVHSLIHAQIHAQIHPWIHS